MLLLTGKRNSSTVLNVPLANFYKYSPSSQFTEIVCDSFFPFCLLASNCVSQYSSKAFLFSLVNKPGWAPVKLPQTGKHSSYRNSIYSCLSHGPVFGGGRDIHITNYASSHTFPSQTLDTPTVHHLATVIAAPSPNHSWQEVTNFNPMKLKYFIKVLETNELK